MAFLAFKTHYYIVNFRSNISSRVEINISIRLSIHQIALLLWETGDLGPDLAHPEDGVQECLGCETRGPVGLWAVSTRQIPRSWVS